MKTREYYRGYRAFHNGAPPPKSTDTSDYARGYWTADEDIDGPGFGVEPGDTDYV
jgi:hypothetical protein